MLEIQDTQRSPTPIWLKDAWRSLGGIWCAGGMLLFAVRSLARVWVTAKRDSAVLPYNGELLLACAITASATGVILLLDSFTSD
ncbi:MAG: hypothetical protein WCL39_01230, partial [Armatimonadota bacterium]